MGSGGKERRLRNAEERARTLFRLQQTAAALSFWGTRASLSPLTSSSSPGPHAPSSPAPAPSLASPPRPPRLPAPLSAQLLCAPLGRRRARRRKTQGTETRDKNVLEEKAKSSAQLGKKFFWWRRVLCRPRRRLAARASFPFPWSGPRASGWRGRRLSRPRGKNSHICG